MKGHFTSHYLAEVLRDIFLQERGGVLNLESASGPKSSFRFDRGMLVDADSASGAAMLAAALREDGLVAADVLLETVADCSLASELVEALGAKGVPRDHITVGMRGLIRRAVADAFSWQGGTFQFREERPAGTAFTPDVLFTLETALGGVAVMSNFEPLREVLLGLPGRLKMNSDVFLPVHRLALKPHHGFVLSRIDGTMSMAELGQVVPADSVDDALKFAYGLLVFTVITLDPPWGKGLFTLREVVPAHHEARARAEREEALIREALSGMEGRTPEQVLGVPQEAGTDVLRAAYNERRSRFRKDKFSGPVREARKRDLELIEDRLTEAFFKLELSALERDQRKARESAEVVKLSEEDLYKRREFFKTEAQTTQEQNARLSEKYYHKAREYHREGDFYNCIQFCRLAIKFNGESAAPHQLMGDALARNPDRRWQRQAEEAYVRATELDPFNVEYFVSLGVFYKERGLDRRARKMFEKALELLPTHAVAARELKSLKS